MSAPAVFAQSSEQADAGEQNADNQVVEVIEVSGIAESYRNAIAEKRNAATILDALSLEDMGALPDLSVAEVLERITGVTGDRFKGNASEVSIRGLGPFLGLSTVNGRAISSGSGNRSVAFSQFPSELINGVTVYKAQKADLLEGGVSGTIDLKTIKPIDYGKERLQAEVRANFNPYHSRQNDENGLGYRPSISYTNTYELDDGAKLGFAIGYAGADVSAPEESYNTSSTLRNCNSDFALDGGSNCSFRDTNTRANGGAAEDGEYFFIPNSFFYRQMESEEDRDAVIFAVQYQPNSRVDINLDGQTSRRFYYEDRHDLVFDDGRRRIANWQVNDEGALLSYSGNSRLSSYGEYRERNEEYNGIGLNIDWAVTERLGANFDASYSGTERYQTRTWTRFRSDRFFYDWQNQGGDNFPTINNVYSDFDDPSGSSIDLAGTIQDLSFFDANSEARNYRFDIKDSINAYRLDFDYLLDNDTFHSVQFGVHSTHHKHDNYREERLALSTPSGERDEKLGLVIDNCATDWPQSDYGSDAYAALSRPDMWYYGSGRNIGGVAADDEVTSIPEALQDNVNALGNPFLEALESDNLDLSLNYFAGEDTLLSGGLYHKSFGARIETQSGFEDVVVDGQSFPVEVNGRPTILDESSTIKGLELTLQHRFATLPEPFNGLGVVFNYNYADSSYQTPEAGAAISDEVQALIRPSNIAGLSDNTISSQLYWEGDDLSVRLSYKFRSEYLKPFGPNLAQTNRIVDDQSTLDLNMSYDLTKNLMARFQVINITNNPYIEQRVAHEAYNRIEYSGVRYFVGLRYRM